MTYTLTTEDPDDEAADTFTISRTTGALLTARELDRERTAAYQLEVRALDASGGPQVTSLISITIEVEDINDEAPTFLEDPILVTVPEDVAIGTPVWNFTAQDKDAGLNGQIRYSITQQWPNEDFTIDSESGTLSILTNLDREINNEYTIVITATDQASNETQRLSTSSTARVIVQDANDHSPRFVSRSRLWLVGDESSGPGAVPLMQVIAVDDDIEDNGRVSYSLHADPDLEGLFVLAFDTGVLTLARPLGRRHRGARMVLNISASDHGKPPRTSSQLLELEVAGGSESPPRFLQTVYEANVSEDAALGTFVVKVSARDPDSGKL